MSEKSTEQFPYKRLGSHLKRRRQKLQASLAEVSGAVEVELETLTAIEAGSRRPTEDILLLLISYFSIKEEEANALWKLAGYDVPEAANESDTALGPQQVMVLPVDARVVYTDMAHVATTPYGITINFMQSSGLDGRPLAVSRVGMSREHALKVLGLLQKALIEDTPKLLPAPENTSDDSTS
jgi:transcriptional regulator with XRE-family HTH domain